MSAEQPLDVEQAIAKLKSFREGDRGVTDVIVCGEKAIPALRRMLFEREPSGLFQPRCRAIEALAGLGAHDVLIEFLEADRKIADPVEQLGEDAVINAAAHSLANVREQHVFELLLRLARRPALTGVIGALGAFERIEALPVLIEALEDDASRFTAESALKKLGKPARAVLLKTAAVAIPEGARESESKARLRRSALRLLKEIGMPRNAWRSLRALLHHHDAKVVALACAIGFDQAPLADRPECAHRMIELLADNDWILREEIETCLVDHFGSVRDEIESYLNEPSGPDTAERRQITATLQRVIARATVAPRR